MELLMNIGSEVWWWLGVTFFVIGVVSAVQAIMETRTAQGAIAWAAVLLVVPIISAPLYWIFGYKRFKGYRKGSGLFSSLALTREHKRVLKQFAEHNVKLKPLFEHENAWQSRTFAYFTNGNEVSIHIDGEAAYARLFELLEQAKEYVLVEYYIIQSDETGKRLMDALIRKSKQGVRCYVIFDGLGAKKYRKNMKKMRAAGVRIYPFETTRERFHKLRLNFRNHRKIFIVDGQYAITGGMNIGDEYIGKHKKLSPWRDTNIELSGPAALLLQYTFQRDWEYVSGEKLKGVSWELYHKPGNTDVLVASTSPATLYDFGSIFFLHLIHAAQKRIWIFNPYFVPDEQFISALQLASLRGVEIRIVTPAVSDSNFIKQIARGVMYNFRDFENIEWREYTDGFMHQKVLLIDDELSLVGTHNFDNRSFRLNFEVSVLVRNKEFQNTIEKMLRDDLIKTRHADKGLYAKLPFYSRFIVRLYSLLSPIS